MMYFAYDMYSKASRPMYHMAMIGQSVVEHPLNPFSYTPFAKPVAATFDTVSRALRCYEKIGFEITSTKVNGRAVSVEETVVLDLPFCELLHFKKNSRAKQPKLLLMAPLSGHHATLLKGTVEALLPNHDLYITDWKDARGVPLSEGPFGIDDYVTNIIRFLEELGPNTHMLAVCQPSVQALVVSAVLAKQDSPLKPASVTIMAGPIDTRESPTAVNEYATNTPIEFFKKRVVSTVPASYPGAGRKVYPGFLQLIAFMSMNMGVHLNKHVSYMSDLIYGRHESVENYREFYDEYLAVMDMPAEFYLESVERVFINHELPKGELTYQGELVDLTAITDTALLTVEGELDDITGLGQTEAAQKLCSNIPDDMRRHHVQEGVGHYGVFNGSRFRAGILPIIEEFIAKADLGGKKAPVKSLFAEKKA